MLRYPNHSLFVWDTGLHLLPWHFAYDYFQVLIEAVELENEVARQQPLIVMNLRAAVGKIMADEIGSVKTVVFHLGQCTSIDTSQVKIRVQVLHR